jgi:hypothetical protein
MAQEPTLLAMVAAKKWLTNTELSFCVRYHFRPRFERAEIQVHQRLLMVHKPLSLSLLLLRVSYL